MRIDHIQLAMPEGQEDEARRFYGRLLEMPEVPKPESVRRRGGCWFRTLGCEVHIGVDPEFRPQRKAHPAFSVPHLDGLAARLTEAGVPVEWDELLPGVRRFYSIDPFGNRVEFVAEGTGLRDVAFPVETVCGALVRIDRILMVRRSGLDGDYWALPGGPIERDEMPEHALVREMRREAGYTVEVSRVLFDAPLPNRHGLASGSLTRCFLVVPSEGDTPAANAGRHPDALVSDARSSPEVEWLRIDEHREDPQVASVVEALGMA